MCTCVCHVIHKSYYAFPFFPILLAMKMLFLFFLLTEEGIVVVKARKKMMICVCYSDPVSVTVILYPVIWHDHIGHDQAWASKDRVRKRKTLLSGSLTLMFACGRETSQDIHCPPFWGTLKLSRLQVVHMHKTGARKLFQFCRFSTFAKRCENTPTAYLGPLSSSSKSSHCRCCKTSARLLVLAGFAVGSMLVLLVMHTVPLVSASDSAT